MSDQPNVILVVLDTVRTDRVSAYGYDRKTTPNFDAFAERATLFTEPIAQAPWSVPAHASLFTGAYPSEHGATTVTPIFREQPSLPVLLSAAGYETYGVTQNWYIRPATGFAQGFDEFETLSPVPEPAWLADVLAPPLNWIARTPRARRPAEWAFNAIQSGASPTTGMEPRDEQSLVSRVDDFLTRASEPFFLFVNLMDAHLPYIPRREHFEEFVDDDLWDIPVVENERAHTFGEGLSDRQFRKLRQLYDASLRTADDRFGELLECFSRAGLLEDSLVVVVSDHGEHLGEFGLVGHQHSVFDSTVCAPLAIQFPDGGPDVVSQQVEHRRVFHTILDETGIESAPERSLSSGLGDAIAYGEYYTPMLDWPALVWDDQVRYDSALLGERLRFTRTGDSKRIEFADDAWCFELPEATSGPSYH